MSIDKHYINVILEINYKLFVRNWSAKKASKATTYRAQAGIAILLDAVELGRGRWRRQVCVQRPVQHGFDPSPVGHDQLVVEAQALHLADGRWRRRREAVPLRRPRATRPRRRQHLGGRRRRRLVRPPGGRARLPGGRVLLMRDEVGGHRLAQGQRRGAALLQVSFKLLLLLKTELYV